MKKLKVVSLFSGIGGFEIGIMDAIGKENVDIVFASEIDKYAAQSYEMYFNHKPHGDITQINEKDVPDHDVLTFGFPCQSFSIAGQRKGFEDTRGTLFFEGARILNKKQPKIFIAENVKGLISHDKPKDMKVGYKSLFNNTYDGKKKGIGNTLKVIEETLSELSYDVYWEILNTKDYGLPQNRERIYFVGFRKDLGVKEFKFPEGFDNGLRLKDLLERVVDEKYYISEDKCKKLLAELKNVKTDDKELLDKHSYGLTYDENKIVRPCLTPDRIEKRQVGRRFKDHDEPSFTINTQDRHGVLLSQKDVEENGVLKILEENKQNVKPVLVGGVGEINYGKQYRQGNRVYSSNSVDMCLLSQPVGNTGGNSYLYLVKTDKEAIENISSKYQFAKDKCIEYYNKNGYLPEMFNPYNQTEITDIAPTQTTSCDRSCSSATVLLKDEYYRIRKLIEKECWRLQGFPDSYHDLVATKISGTQRYKQAGNAVSTVVVKCLFEKIVETLQNKGIKLY